MKILLACSAGMSTSLLEKSIKDYMAANNIKGECIAKSTINALGEMHDWDVVLLGPQVKFELPKFKDAADGKMPVDTIPPADYAMAKGEAVYKFAEKLIKG